MSIILDRSTNANDLSPCYKTERYVQEKFPQPPNLGTLDYLFVYRFKNEDTPVRDRPAGYADEARYCGNCKTISDPGPVQQRQINGGSWSWRLQGNITGSRMWRCTRNHSRTRFQSILEAITQMQSSPRHNQLDPDIRRFQEQPGRSRSVHHTECNRHKRPVLTHIT